MVIKLTKIPAIITPVIFALENSFFLNPNKKAANAPVQTPEPGNGTPINKASPIVPYLLTYLYAFFCTLSTHFLYIFSRNFIFKIWGRKVFRR